MVTRPLQGRVTIIIPVHNRIAALRLLHLLVLLHFLPLYIPGIHLPGLAWARMARRKTSAGRVSPDDNALTRAGIAFTLARTCLPGHLFVGVSGVKRLDLLALPGVHTPVMAHCTIGQ